MLPAKRRPSEEFPDFMRRRHRAAAALANKLGRWDRMVLQHHLGFMGHLARLPDDRLAKAVLVSPDSLLAWRRSQRAPAGPGRRHWQQARGHWGVRLEVDAANVLQWARSDPFFSQPLQEIWFGQPTWVSVAQDRSLWRWLVLNFVHLPGRRG
jgi:hypothetical protein